MTADLMQLWWPPERLAEALEALGRLSKLSRGSTHITHLPDELHPNNDEALGEWISANADLLNLEAQPVFASYAELEQVVYSLGPALIRLRIGNEVRFLALLAGGSRRAILLDPGLKKRKVSTSIICSALREPLELPLTPQLDSLLENVGVARRRRGKARQAILREQLSAFTIGGFWALRLPPGASFFRQLRHAGVQRNTAILAVAHAAQYALSLMAWFVIGRAALQGRLDYATLVAWAMILLTTIPLRLLTTWKQGVSAIRAGGLLKQRLLYGALRLNPDQIRHQGAGQLLGRIVETDAVETMALNGGFHGLLAIIELTMAAAVLSMGSGGWLHAGLLLVWTGLALLIGWTYLSKRRQWMEQRMSITNDLVESMVGHRTRLAQEPREHWHDAEDRSLEHYFRSSKQMDRIAVLLSTLLPRGWLVIGIAGLALNFVRGSSSTGLLAVGLGGVLLAYSALRRMAAGISQLTDAVIAWQQVALIFHSGALKNSNKSESTLVSGLNGSLETGAVLLDGRDLAFRYSDRTEAVISGCDLRIKAGDKLLIEGPSGGGKSTLASLLVGLRQPDSGLLLLRGFDRRTLGDANWRRLVVSAPQFHENHVLSETFAFNLLMGRRWPARPEDLEECEAVCRELGLGDLIDRMPAGLNQMVGETGWQLSHGERSRLYIARALLQRADLVLLDESFAALDPENLRRALTCVLNRVQTLVVIAHP
ncbi:MAG TPA: ABC transporter ATP-binding protein [Pyrinomonadaceae bacterium]|nr:ABC transporter ATP-binding protein [Pyrinomonadaceae bacterium]